MYFLDYITSFIGSCHLFQAKAVGKIKTNLHLKHKDLEITLPSLPPKVNINLSCLNTIDVMYWKKEDGEKTQLKSYASIYHIDFLLVDLQIIFISFYVFSSISHILQCIFVKKKKKGI